MTQQRELERSMREAGMERAKTRILRAEQAGRAVTNPYSQELFDEYVVPLAQAIETELASHRAGKRQAHAMLLRGMDYMAVAALTVRATMNFLLQHHDLESRHHRRLGYHIGRTIHHELVLVQIEAHNPDLYHTLANDFGRRLSKDERHRMTVFKMQAAKAGIPITEWSIGARDQVGLYLLGLLEVAGLVEIFAPAIKHGKRTNQQVALSLEVMQRIEKIKDYVCETLPAYGPCVERPIPWTSPSSGGFHTPELRRVHPTLVRHRLAKTPYYRDADMPTVLKAVNTMQETAWQVNARMLGVVLEVARHFNVGELITITDLPRPDRPANLGDDKTTFTEEETAAFKSWKRKMADWHTDKRIRATKFGRFYSATRSAAMFKQYPEIYFVYFADSRGRLYPMTYGLNPQGSDLQRALIHFAEGLPLETPEAIRWFHVQGANKWGFDKATLQERHQWVVDRQDLILLFAEDPVNNRGWVDADKPLQFLAWCMEYRDWVMDTSGTFVSRLPISMDGSCNGLQNLSALFKDEVGGAATNLVPSEKMADLYTQVAQVTLRRLGEASYPDNPEKEALRLQWIAHGVGRQVVKRAVMTTPYGVTKRSAADYVVRDYLEKVDNPFCHRDRLRAAGVLVHALWDAIGEVVVKAQEAMRWLQKSARVILSTLDEDNPVICWASPSGFPASQAYFEVQIHRINTRLHGVSKIRVASEADRPDRDKHINGMAPNFVHSMDAAHLHLTTARCHDMGIRSVAMIHDDYGTHAANAQALYTAIREEFVKMYSGPSPILALTRRYPNIPPPPVEGTLDITGVLKSTYFFS